MKTAWLFFWIAFAAAEVGLTFWSHSTTFLEIGAVVLLMIAYNLQRVHVGTRKVVQVPVEGTPPGALIG